MALLNNPSLNIGWVKGHVGVLGKETADKLAKQATIRGEIHYFLATKSYLKNLLHKVSINKWQQEWATGDTGRTIYNISPKVITNPVPWTRESILFATRHGSFPSYLRKFNLHHSDLCACGEVGTSFHYATTCYLTTSYYFTKPSKNLTSIWWRNTLNNKLSRFKIINLVSFLTENGNLIIPQYEQNNTSDVDSSSDAETFSPSTR
ncbi:hypothetical protein AVEN_223502-1 [Araneus ventricosus]|uniref:RNase H type-1 domain-containing protein n=1 Tax=Araneus ventricosus TaxID=182803 RepID=A0A4Y2DIF2_ARAVE|nr:hypothetical protein AVEN_223502-1 [Araneus ventricosus]